MDKREKMVSVIRDEYGLDNPRVFSAMLQVPREKFAPKNYQKTAYDDEPVSIGYGQTMSQPYTVAFMTHLLVGLRARGKRDVKDWKVLEVGTGSGYQAAVLSQLVSEVYTIEIIPPLAERARRKLSKLGFKNVFVRQGKGELGWLEKAPFDAILITAGIYGEVPKLLFQQLKGGGVLVAPVGEGHDKTMTKYVKLKSGKLKKKEFGLFSFVPFIEE